MQCISCNAAITSKMKSALYSNTCPFCGGHILEPRKARQYADLIVVLEKTQLTNRTDVDLQIKEKLVDVLTKHFEFTKLEGAEVDEDIIVIPETATEEAPIPDAVIPRSAKTAARAAKRSKKASGIEDPNLSPVARMYQQAQEGMYAEDDDDDSLADLDKITAEEAAQYFPETVPDELSGKVEKYKKIYKERMGKADGAGGGIKRL